MITIGNKERSIRYSLSTDIVLRDNMFSIELPKIECSNKLDAEFIQRQMNALIGDLSHSLLLKK